MAFKRTLAVASLISFAAAAAGDGIAGISWGPQRLDVFGADSEDNIFHKYYTSFGWGPDDAKHGNLELFTKASVSEPVSAVSWGQNRMDFFFVDQDGAALHKYWDGSSWGPHHENGFDKLGEGVGGKLAVSSWGENRFDVFGLSADQTYVHKTWTGYGYYPAGEQWESLGGEFASSPAAVSWGPGRIDVFGVTNEGNISHKYWAGDSWHPHNKWEDLGGKGFTGEIFVSSWGPNRFDIWATTKAGQLYHLFWDGFSYQGWENLGGNFLNAPQVVHWGPNRIDILGKDADKGNYVYKYFDGFNWSHWQNKGGEFHSEPALVNIGVNNLNLFGVDKAGKLKLQVWDGRQWLPSHDGWYELGNTKLGGGDSHDRVNVGEKVLGEEDANVRIELKFKA